MRGWGIQSGLKITKMETYGIQFSEPKTIRTIRGERLLRSGKPTQEFWATWAKKKEELKDAGISVTKTNGGFVVNFWEEPNVEEKNERIDDSKKTDSNFKAIAPRGSECFGYQNAGVEYILNAPSCLLADEMGLGKTIQAIIAFNMVNAKKVLVICPASLKLNWEKEIKKWSTNPYRVHIIGPARWNVPRIGSHVVIINYDILKKHHAKVHGEEWDFVAIDEAHFVKSPKAMRSIEILGKEHTKSEIRSAELWNERNPGDKMEVPVDIPPLNAKRKLMITGTPRTSKTKDLFPLLHYLDPVEWDNFFKFGIRYCRGHKRDGYWNFDGSSNLDELNTRLRSTIMIRRLKSDVLKDLPDKLRQPIVWSVTSREEKESVAAEADYMKGNLSDILDSVSKGKGYKVDFENVAKTRKKIAMAKLPKVANHVLETLENENQIVVFFHHKDLLRGVQDALTTKDIPYTVLTGDTPNPARQKAVDDFQDGKVRVFLGTMGAAGVGITLTAARTVIFAELPGDWNPSTLLQSEDRLHRIGQKNNVLIQYLVLEGTIEAHIADVVSGKDKTAYEILDREEIIETKELPEAVKPKPLPKPVKPKPEPETMSQEEMNRVRTDLNRIASMDGDRALEKNYVGFNKFDSNIGHSLANNPDWTPRQAQVAKSLTIKYRRQLSG